MKSNAYPNADLNAIPNAKVDAESVICSNSKNDSGLEPKAETMDRKSGIE